MEVCTEGCRLSKEFSKEMLPCEVRGMAEQVPPVGKCFRGFCPKASGIVSETALPFANKHSSLQNSCLFVPRNADLWSSCYLYHPLYLRGNWLNLVSLSQTGSGDRQREVCGMKGWESRWGLRSILPCFLSTEVPRSGLKSPEEIREELGPRESTFKKKTPLAVVAFLTRVWETSPLKKFGFSSRNCVWFVQKRKGKTQIHAIRNERRDQLQATAAVP